MIVAEHIQQLKKAINHKKNANPKGVIGFVPTMGALHNGHLQLIEKASQESDIVIVSIFVNPTQFNDPEDLKKYPRTISADIEKLEKSNCDILFLPHEKEVYPDGINSYKIDFSGLDKVMEGKYRDDHFVGVAMVVERLFDIVQPNKAFFGLKDFQQVAIIKHLVRVRQIDVEIVPVNIVRSPEGLALSSRNQLLSKEQKEDALIIYNTLLFGKSLAKEYDNTADILRHMKAYFDKGSLKLEYMEIVDPNTLKPLQSLEPGAHCCIAAYCGEVRLIDNMQIR
ncbi:MAG: pantoate--beta-alanine ligase [Crocinitomicaceae bacterium]|nr:pantoate--beta-alanine ligase [Crocinitomicaceae bacterium]